MCILHHLGFQRFFMQWNRRLYIAGGGIGAYDFPKLSKCQEKYLFKLELVRNSKNLVLLPIRILVLIILFYVPSTRKISRYSLARKTHTIITNVMKTFTISSPGKNLDFSNVCMNFPVTALSSIHALFQIFLVIIGSWQWAEEGVLDADVVSFTRTGQGSPSPLHLAYISSGV